MHSNYHTNVYHNTMTLKHLTMGLSMSSTVLQVTVAACDCCDVDDTLNS